MRPVGRPVFYVKWAGFAVKFVSYRRRDGVGTRAEVTGLFPSLLQENPTLIERDRTNR